jgi:hypothetical protein
MTIRVRIDRVVLDGLPVSAAQAPHVHAAIVSELSRLFTEHGVPRDRAGLPPRGTATPSLRAPEMRLPHGEPSGTGRRIAGAVYRSLARLR